MSSTPPPRPWRSWIRRNPLLLIGVLLLGVIAATPPDIAGLLAFFDGLLLWALFSIPLARATTANAAGCAKLFYGACGIVMAGLRTAVLIAIACAAPASRWSPH